MTDDNVMRFIAMNKFPNRLLFINKERKSLLNMSDNNHCISVLGGGNASLLNFCDLVGHRSYDKYIDYVDFLNNLI